MIEAEPGTSPLILFNRIGPHARIAHDMIKRTARAKLHGQVVEIRILRGPEPAVRNRRNQENAVLP